VGKTGKRGDGDGVRSETAAAQCVDWGCNTSTTYLVTILKRYENKDSGAWGRGARNLILDYPGGRYEGGLFRRLSIRNEGNDPMIGKVPLR